MSKFNPLNLTFKFLAQFPNEGNKKVEECMTLFKLYLILLNLITRLSSEIECRDFPPRSRQFTNHYSVSNFRFQCHAKPRDCILSLKSKPEKFRLGWVVSLKMHKIWQNFLKTYQRILIQVKPLKF